MCFSAKASFISSALITAVGLLNLRQVRNKTQMGFALIPLVFAFQQFLEGILWTVLPSGASQAWLINLSKTGYLGIALVVWPFLIPLAITLVETNPLRRRWLQLFLFAGTGIALYNFTYMWDHTLPVIMKENRLQYYIGLPSESYLYLAIVVIPGFISSFKNMWQFSFLIFLGSLIAYWIYTDAFTSVWCFLAGMVSLVIFKIFRDNPSYDPKRMNSF